MQRVSHPEPGDKIFSLHVTKHVGSIVADADMPYVEATGQVADLCLSPAGSVQRQSLGMMLMASQAAIDGCDIVVARLASQEAEAATASQASASQLLAPAAEHIG